MGEWEKPNRFKEKQNRQKKQILSSPSLQYKCMQEQRKPIREEQQAVHLVCSAVSACSRRFASRGGLAEHRCRDTMVTCVWLSRIMLTLLTYTSLKFVSLIALQG